MKILRSHSWPLNLGRVLLFVLILCGMVGSSQGEVVFYNIDQTQSDVTLTLFGIDFSGAVDGTFFFAADPGIEEGAWDILWDFDATVEDINAGIASLTDITIQSDPTKDAFGEITDPDLNDGEVSLNQFLPMIIRFTYTPLFGTPENHEIYSESCFGEVILCDNPSSSGEATIQTATLRFDASAQDTIPAEDNPLGEDMPVRLVLKADGTTSGLSDARESDREWSGPGLEIRPNPSQGPVTISLGAYQGISPQISVFDLAGRRVRSLQPSAGNGFTYQWDGRDSAGMQTPAGIYFIRCQTGETVSYSRCLRLR